MTASHIVAAHDFTIVRPQQQERGEAGLLQPEAILL